MADHIKIDLRNLDTSEQVAEVKRLLAAGHSQTEVSQTSGVSFATVHKVASGKQWQGEVVRR